MDPRPVPDDLRVTPRVRIDDLDVARKPVVRGLPGEMRRSHGNDGYCFNDARRLVSTGPEMVPRDRADRHFVPRVSLLPTRASWMCRECVHGHMKTIDSARGADLVCTGGGGREVPSC